MKQIMGLGADSKGRWRKTFAVAVIAFVASLWLIEKAFSWLGVPADVGLNLDLFDVLRVWEERVGEARRDPNRIVVAMVGDSLTLSSPQMEEAHRTALPERLEASLARRRGEPEASVVPLRWGGLGPVEVFALADRIAAARAPVVVLSCNLLSLAPSWALSLNRGEFAAWIEPRRLPLALTMPLHRVGLSADRVLWYVSLRELGLWRLWQAEVRLQALGSRARDNLQRSFDVLVGSNAEQRAEQSQLAKAFLRARIPGQNRNTRSAVLRAYAPVLGGVGPDHAILRFLTSGVHTIARSGARVVVVAMPVNLEHWRAVGALDDATGVRRTIDTLEQQAAAAGALFVDLHDLLPDESFRDRAAHFTFAGPDDGIERVADALAAALAPVVTEAAAR